jgi:hypothetical protein
VAKKGGNLGLEWGMRKVHMDLRVMIAKKIAKMI